MPTDAEIARNASPRHIADIAARLGFSADDIECYGKYKAKLPLIPGDKKGKLVLVTAMNPTPLGEGKTTVSISLADGLVRAGKNAVLALREPSLGPVFGIKGGACGGGYAQVIPMEDINLHFTGDFHAVTAANNLLAALVDNHIHFARTPEIAEVVWTRCLDINDRALREVEIGLGGKANGPERKDGFVITAASEIMAVLCMADGFADLKRRLGDIVVGYTADGEKVTARDIRADEAMAILLRDASRPNLVQTLEGTPALVHGGPFANARPLPRGHSRHRGGIRRRTRRRKVLRHQMQKGGSHPLLHRARGHRKEPEIQRRRPQRGDRKRKCRRARKRLRKCQTAP